MPATKDLLLEIGTEELPAAFVHPALEALHSGLSSALTEARLSHAEVEVYGTPRRIAVIARKVAAGQPDRVREVHGPPQRAAFDADGRPTKAAEGFARGQGVPVDALEIIETPKGPYVAARVEEKGQEAEAILPGVLRDVVAGLPFKKSMRWGDVDVAFARPIHWIVALLGSKALSFEYGDVKSDKRTRGHRFLANDPFVLRGAKGYLEKLEEANVIADVTARRTRVRASAEAALAERDPNWRLREDDDLLEEVTQLVEWPVAIVGGFDPSHLELPAEVLISEMRQHQRYFSVIDTRTGQLAPAFVAISNTPVRDPAVARHGYERVLIARLADARYFYETDRARRLEARVDDLSRVVFQEKLGTIHEKVDRVRALSLWLASRLGLEERQKDLARTVTLCKADLTTGMVGEFPELQGVMGRYYASLDGEPEAVSTGIEEHYLPRHTGDRLPTAHEGALAGIADRLDTIVGIFGIDKPPTGAADPFGLRRACLGIVNISLDRGYRIGLSAAVDEALELFVGRLILDAATVRARVLEFFRTRLKNLWSSQGHPADVVEAVLSAGFDDLVSARERIEALSGLKGRPDFLQLAEAFTRASNIVAKAPSIDAVDVDAELFEDPAEGELWKASMSVREKVDKALSGHDYQTALQEMIALKAPVGAFFDKVLVMAEDARIRDNRLLLLRGIVDLFARIADFSQIQSEPQDAGQAQAKGGR
jgi:glycyl-tRNA synthetase beta chain